MAEFTYRGRDENGRLVSGKISAGSSQGAVENLQSQRVVVLALEELKKVRTEKSSLSLRSVFPQKISDDDLILFTRQLYALTKAGIPILRAMNGLAESSNNEALSTVLADISQSLISGSDLSGAFRRHPKVFSTIYVSLVQVGESTGKLDDALKRLISHLESERETQKRIKAALRYPMMVIFAIAVALAVITVFVIPSFSSVFSKLGADLPWATRLLMGASDFVRNNGLLLLTALTLSYFGLRFYIRTDEGRLWWDRKRLRWPLLGSIFERIALSRFSRSFAMMLSAGVPILSSFNIVAETVGNKFVGNAVRSMHSGVERGDRLTNAAAATGLFTPLVLQMMTVGEETGSVDRLLDEVADFYEQEIDYELKQLADAVEPILLAFMGGLVLILALGVFLPVWDLGTAATGRG